MHLFSPWREYCILSLLIPLLIFSSFFFHEESSSFSIAALFNSCLHYVHMHLSILAFVCMCLSLGVYFEFCLGFVSQFFLVVAAEAVEPKRKLLYH